VRKRHNRVEEANPLLLKIRASCSSTAADGTGSGGE